MELKQWSGDLSAFNGGLLVLARYEDQDPSAAEPRLIVAKRSFGLGGRPTVFQGKPDKPSRSMRWEHYPHRESCYLVSVKQT